MFKIYSKEGIIGYAKSINPFKTPEGNGIMLEDFVEVKDSNNEVSDVISKPVFKETIIESQDREVVRDRLPNLNKDNNKVNVFIDGSSKVLNLDEEDPEIIEASYFMCPGCGQSSVVIVDGVPVLRVAGHEILKTGSFETDPFNYEEAIKTEGLEDVKLKADHHIKGFCLKCFNEDTLREWIAVFEDPGSVFEYEDPCFICGGETTLNIGKENKREKICEVCKFKE